MAEPEDILKNIQKNISKESSLQQRLLYLENERDNFFAAGSEKETFKQFTDALLDGVTDSSEREQLFDKLIESKIKAETSVHDRVEFIKEWGNALSSVNTKDEQHQAMIDRLMNGVESESDKNQIVGTLIDCEWNNCKDSNPATFMRSTNLFKIAMEQPMNWQIENNPELANQYRADPIKFMLEQYKIPDVIKEKFNTVIQAQKSGEDFKPESAMHNLVFASLNGPMVKHHIRQSRVKDISPEEQTLRSKQFLELSSDKAQAVTDANMVISGTYKAKQVPMLERGMMTKSGRPKPGHQVKENEIYEYLNVLDGLLTEVDPTYPEGTISNNPQIENNIVDFEQKRHDFNSQVKVQQMTGLSQQEREFLDKNPIQPPEPSLGQKIGNFFKAAGKAIANAFKVMGRGIKSLFSSSSTSTVTRPEQSSSEPTTRAENTEAKESNTEKGLGVQQMKTAEVDVARESKIEKTDKIIQRIERTGGRRVATQSVQDQLNQVLQDRKQEQKSKQESDKGSKAA